MSRQHLDRLDASRSPQTIAHPTNNKSGEKSTADTNFHLGLNAGKQLPPPVRSRMERSFKTDFSAVKIHEGSYVGSLGAIAYTQGNHIHFDAGRFDLHSSAGQQLLGHELAHVVQQRQNRVVAPSGSMPINDDANLEAEADRLGAQAAQGEDCHAIAATNEPISTNSPVIQLARKKPVGPGGRYIAGRVFGAPAVRQSVPASPSTRVNPNPHKVDPNSAFQQINPISIASTGNNVLTGRHFLAPPAPQGVAPLPGTGKTVLFLSGSGCSSEKYSEPIAEEYAKMGANIFAANYRGFGGSHNTNPNATHEKDPSEAGLYEDAQAMYNHLTTPVNQGGLGLNPADILVHGYSLGGPIAANLVKELTKQNVQLGGLVLHSPMPTASEAANDSLLGTGFPTKTLLGSFDTRSKLRKIASRDAALPIHFMSGETTSGDQLSLQKYPLHVNAGRSIFGTHPFTNVSHDITPGANHFETADHMKNQGTQAALQNMLQNGRNRVPGAAAIIQPQNNNVVQNNPPAIVPPQNNIVPLPIAQVPVAARPRRPLGINRKGVDLDAAMLKSQQEFEKGSYMNDLKNELVKRQAQRKRSSTSE